MNKLAEKHRETMSQCDTFDEWAKRFLKVEPSRKWENAFKAVHKQEDDDEAPVGL